MDDQSAVKSFNDRTIKVYQNRRLLAAIDAANNARKGDFPAAYGKRPEIAAIIEYLKRTKLPYFQAIIDIDIRSLKSREAELAAIHVIPISLKPEECYQAVQTAAYRTMLSILMRVVNMMI